MNNAWERAERALRETVDAKIGSLAPPLREAFHEVALAGLRARIEQMKEAE